MRLSLGLRTISAKAIALILSLTIATIVAITFLILHHFNSILGTDRLKQNLSAAEEMINPDRLPYTVKNGVMTVGNRVLNNNETIADGISSSLKCTVAVFTGGKRIMTSVKRADGTRAVGTDIAPEVQTVVSQGNHFIGEAMVVGEPYVTAYMPLLDANGVPVGSLGVGFVKKTFNKTFYDAALFAGMCGLVLALICAGIGLTVFRKLFAPFKPLSALMLEAQNGRYTTDVPFTDRTDEFGTLAEVILDFNKAMIRQEQNRHAAEAEKERAAEAQKAAEAEAQRRSEQLVVSTFGEGLEALAEGTLEYRLTADVPSAYRGLKDNFNHAMQIAETNRSEREEAAKQRERDRVTAEKAQKQAEEEAQIRSERMVVSSFGEGLKSLAARDLTFRMSYDLPPGYRKLQDDFNAAIDQLSTVMQEIDGRASEIAAGAKQVSEASREMSQRTERQAASLEETSAAMEEVTATVGRSADNARDASSAASSAQGNAQSSNEIAHATMAAMQRIAKSSGEIAQIIGVIDEIAFQTNLLALNAGVEAARAGDAGKGFAVVASEVRALAQRSAEAAKQIKALIKTSEGEVDSGVKLVDDNNQALEGILCEIERINALMAEVAQSQHEQTTALAEINTAVTHMDQTTQQNAAMAEESTAASQAMADNARELAELIGRFKTGIETRGKRLTRAA